MKLTSFDWWYLGLTAPVVAVGAVYLLPGVLDWPRLGLIVTLQIAWLAAVTLLHAGKVLGVPGAIVFCGLALGISWIVESNLLRATVFGSDYDYAGFLGPRLPGGVPFTIPLMWFGLAYLAWLYSLGAAGCVGSPGRALVCGYVLGAFDLLLDPIATATRTFVWHNSGSYYSTPLTNFAGWFGVGVLVSGGYTVFERWGCDRRPLTDTTMHQRVAGLFGLAAFALPAVLAVIVGRAGAALWFFAALTPVVVAWLIRTAPVERPLAEKRVLSLPRENPLP